MKGFFEERFPVTIKVRVTFSDGSTHEDEIKGLNVGHALYRARDNWEGAAIEVVS